MLILRIITVSCGLLWLVLSINPPWFPLREFLLEKLSDITDWVNPWLSRVLIVAFAISSFLQVRADGYSHLYLWIITVVCGFGWEAWTFESVRDVVVERFEGSLPHILGAVFAVLFVFGIWPVAEQPPACSTPPCITPTPTPTASPSAPPCGSVLSGHIIQKEGREPISGVNIRVGQEEAISNADGSFQVPLCSSLRDDTLVRVSHNDYMTSFFRRDDFTLGQQREVELVPKMRIIVLDAGEKGAVQLDQDQQNSITSNLESQFEGNEIGVFAEGNLKSQIIDKLHQYQEERALYNPKTLQRVGEFHGATHGMFYSVRRQGPSSQLDLKLVSFKTSRTEKTASIRLEKDDQLSDAAVYLANQLLSQLAEIQILSPKTGTKTNRLVNVEGFARFRPKTWTLWVTILPINDPLHYPQQRVTPKEDGSWFASSVFLGEENPVARLVEFRVYVVFTDPEHTAKIEQYLDQLKSDPKKNTGLDLNAWDKSSCRVLAHINLTRTD
jgi:hypothetical protein